MHGPRRVSRSHSWCVTAALYFAASFAAASCSANVVVYETDSEAEALAEEGPKALAGLLAASGGVGLVRGGWPMVVDYRAADTPMAVEVVVEGFEPWSLALPAHDGDTVGDTDGDTRRRVVEGKLPKRLGKDLQVAVLRIVSDAGEIPEAFRLLGLGCGPRAVGSIAIDRIDFSPREIKAGGAPATWKYRPLSDFDHAEVMIFLRKRTERGLEAIPVATRGREDNIRRRQLRAGPWDGQTDAGEVSLGIHTMSVRLWRRTTKEGRKGGDWLVAEAADQHVKVVKPD